MYLKYSSPIARYEHTKITLRRFDVPFFRCLRFSKGAICPGWSILWASLLFFTFKTRVSI